MGAILSGRGGGGGGGGWINKLWYWPDIPRIFKAGHEKLHYRKVSNIRRTFVGNTIVDHSDVVGASPVGAAPTTSSFST